jgi:hypothetical protein
LCEAIIEQDEHVYPMVEAGMALDELKLHPDLGSTVRQDDRKG